MQNSAHLIMIRPAAFGYNAQTAVNNEFQKPDTDQNVQEKALAEFDAFVSLLLDNNIDVTVIQDTTEPHTPDSIFPNNWFSFHNGIFMLYPMFAENRRLERKNETVRQILQKFPADRIEDLSVFEQENRFLEGTGSMVLDRENRLAYACLSPRTDERVLGEFCRKLDYRPVMFHAYGSNGMPVYHTNVLMTVADHYVVICTESITDPDERKNVEQTIGNTGKEIVPITMEQMNSFAGNMLQVVNRNQEKVLIMSTRAFHSLSSEQIKRLRKFNGILHADLSTIETNGGGSARCMLAEVFQ